MNVFEAIRSELADDAAIAAIASTRIYHGERPQNSALPAVAFDEVSGLSYQDMTAGSVGVAMVTVQVNCYAATPGDAHDLREAVRLRMQNWINSPMGGVGGVQVWACIFAGQSGGYEPQTGIVVRSVDFDVHYGQPTS